MSLRKVCVATNCILGFLDGNGSPVGSFAGPTHVHGDTGLYDEEVPAWIPNFIGLFEDSRLDSRVLLTSVNV